MKYWRYRMYLLPKDDKCTKRILEENLDRCDIYTQDKSSKFYKCQVDDFVKFVENNINKLKKIRNVKSPTVTSSHYTRRRHSTSTSIHSSAANSHSQNLHSPLKEPFRERVGSNRYPEKQRPR
jgi:hypothetical protein